MTALTRAPYNKDLLQSTKFRVTFDRLPGTTYFCQTANFPGVSLTEIPRQTPFVDLYVPGEKIVYEYTNKNNSNFRVKFIDLFPTSLSTILFSSQDSAENIVTADATFRFSYYDYERI